MIQKESARNGQAIFKVDGLSVVSSFDPAKEATAWALRTLREVGTHTHLIVIGAGCGYHIAALKNLQPSLTILTIEASAEIKTAVLEIHTGFNETDILIANAPLELTSSMKLRDVFGGRFAVAVHPAQSLMRAEWTRSIENFLTGRDALSFFMQLRMRPELHALFDENKIAALGQTDGPISILSIRDLFKTENGSSRERRIWRVLEELIV